MRDKIEFTSVDQYINTFPKETGEMLMEMRTLISGSAPKAEEGISYNIPAYKEFGMLVYFAGYKSHIGFYPTPSALRHFKDELTTYKTSKGAVQFPIGKPLPKALIKKIVKFRVLENREKEILKKEGKSAKQKTKL